MFLKNLFKKSYPRLDWIQVEVSSFCNAECVYCPHTEYRNNWQNRIFPVELFRSLIPAFAKTKLVYLQGWGEPFTHPDFIEFLRIAKKSGCMVGTTTNGMLLNPEKISELIDEGIDIICFSLAGVDEKNDSIRRGSRVSQVLKCIEDIHRIKNSKSLNNPRIHIAYMLLRSGLEEIHNLPAFLENAGIDQAVISSLSLVVNEKMVRETLSEGDLNILETGLIHRRTEEFIGTMAGQEPVSTDIAFNIVSPQMKESYCSENIERAMVIGADGSVFPCVMGLIPAAGDNFYYFGEHKKKIERFSFGNIAEETLNTIWDIKEYKGFIREQRYKNFVQPCEYCHKRFIVDLS